ncbi:MAG: acetolactate synthase [Verrucomicrobiota bacterium]
MEIDDTAPLTAPPGTPVVQLSVFLENRVGALLSIVRCINDLHVEVVGLSVVDSVDVTVVRMVVTDPGTVTTLFIERGIPFSETRLVVVQMDEGAHGLSACLAALLEGETNIHFSYPLLTRPQGKAALVLCLEDPDFGITILRRIGFKVLYQEDLSR